MISNPESFMMTVSDIFYYSACCGVPVLMAFSFAVRKAIGIRDGWKCQNDGCDKSFQNGDMVHASHINHDKSQQNYDSAGNGRIQCVDHHQQYHQDHVGNSRKIGLSENGNNWAINQLQNTDRRTKNG